MYIRYFWQGIKHIYGHIRCMYTLQAIPIHIFIWLWPTVAKYIAVLIPGISLPCLIAMASSIVGCQCLLLCLLPSSFSAAAFGGGGCCSCNLRKTAAR